MKRIVHVKISKSETQFVADCVELPLVTQDKTLDELNTNIQEAVALCLEDEDFEIVRL